MRDTYDEKVVDCSHKRIQKISLAAEKDEVSVLS